MAAMGPIIAADEQVMQPRTVRDTKGVADRLTSHFQGVYARVSGLRAGLSYGSIKGARGRSGNHIAIETSLSQRGKTVQRGADRVLTLKDNQPGSITLEKSLPLTREITGKALGERLFAPELRGRNKVGGMCRKGELGGTARKERLP